MSTSTRRRGNRGALAAGLASVALLGGCAGNDGSSAEAAAESASTAAGSTATETSAPDLASGLLPAEAFGPDATVIALSLEQLGQGAGIAAAGAEGLQITPESCTTAVEGTQPSFDDFGDVVAQSATSGATATVEVLVRGGPIENAVAQLAAAPERCPQAEITSPEIGSASVTFESLPVDELGDDTALVRYTTALTLPDGTQTTIPTLIGAVEDGDRLLMLITIDAGAAAGDPAAAPLDPVAFADLLAEAYEVQAGALD